MLWFDTFSFSSSVPTSQEYPPTALTATTTNVSAAYGSGPYTLSASGPVNPAEFNAFDKNNNTFINFNSSTYNSSTLAYNGSVSTTVSSSAVLGDWFTIQLPTAITLTSYSLTCRNDAAFGQIPRIWTIAASNDGSTWTFVDSRSGIAWTQGQTQTFNTTNGTSFNRYRFIIQAAEPFPAIVEWKLFGY